MHDDTVRKLLRDMFDAAIAATQPTLTLPRHLPEHPKDRTIVIGAGEASAVMAHVFEQAWGTSVNGLVVARYRYAVPCKQIHIVEAARPVPDAAGLLTAREMLDLVSGLTESDLVVCLISSGGSSLLPLPLPDISLTDKQAASRALPASGATITEMSCMRRRLSAIKGGRLATACYPAHVYNLLLSNVPGDDPVDIASGPTVPDTTTLTDTLDIIRHYDITIPPPVRNVLTSKDSGTIKPGDTHLSRIETRLIATPCMALQTAACVARETGFAVYVLDDTIEGEAHDVGKVLGDMALEVAHHAEPFPIPYMLLPDGETTVAVRGKGRGGRNVEFLSSLMLALRRQPGVHAIAGDTNSVDGLEEIAGATVTPDTSQHAWQFDLHAQDALACNDGHGFFEALGDTVMTGPTMIDVNDSRAVLIAPDSE